MNHRRTSVQDVMGATVLGLVVGIAMPACSSEQPKSLPPPTPDQVRSHADRTFDKLKQEEKERPTQTEMPR
jgi:hypothetical protein